MNEPVTGAIPSAFDYRDGYAAAGAERLAGLEPIPYQTQLAEPMNQRRIPACVGHSVVDLIKLYWYRKTGRWIDFSSRFLDILSSEPYIALEGGRQPRVVLKVGANLGCCTTATLPNDTTLPIARYRDLSAISGAAYAEALQYKIPGYIRVPIDVEKTRQAVRMYGATTSLFIVGKELWTPSWDAKDIDPLRTPEGVISGHQMTVYGWEDLNLVQNEWGVSWASQGRASYDPVEWAPYTLEQWALAEIPEDVAAFLKSLPSPSEFRYRFDRDMRRGQDGRDVKWAQVGLMILGFLTPVPPEQLGFYGPKTSAAVGAYQRARGITVPSPDNIGPLTRRALNADFAL